MMVKLMEIFWEVAVFLFSVICPVTVLVFHYLHDDDHSLGGDIVGPTYWGRYQGAPVAESMHLRTIEKPSFTSQVVREHLVYLP